MNGWIGLAVLMGSRNEGQFGGSKRLFAAVSFAVPASTFTLIGGNEMPGFRQVIHLTIFLALAAAAAFSQQSTPKAAVESFYKFDRANSQTFNRQNIEVRKKWLSKELYDLLLNELDREAEYLRANPTDKPHFGDGLPFQPLAEICEVGGKKYSNSYRFGRVTIKGEIANVDVIFFHPKACKFDDTVFGLRLGKENGKWVIEDVLFVADHSTLQQDLRRTAY
ncbi:MAG TPA: hypothetical protein PKD26_10035 [Pyrinomonadaceae bacterium]|nr:hypothetical protein [Pyrinomonadaceae bacterium]